MDKGFQEDADLLLCLLIVSFPNVALLTSDNA
jgi:hypothetical protein